MERVCLYISLAIYMAILMLMINSQAMDKSPDFKLVRSASMQDLQAVRASHIVIPEPIRPIAPIRRYYYRPNTPYDQHHHQSIVVPMSPTDRNLPEHHVHWGRNIVIDIDLIERHRQTTTELEETRQQLAIKHRRLKIAIVSTVTSLAGLGSALITYFSTKC